MDIFSQNNLVYFLLIMLVVVTFVHTQLTDKNRKVINALREQILIDDNRSTEIFITLKRIINTGIFAVKEGKAYKAFEINSRGEGLVSIDNENSTNRRNKKIKVNAPIYYKYIAIDSDYFIGKGDLGKLIERVDKEKLTHIKFISELKKLADIEIKR